MSFRGMINIYRSQLFQKLQVALSARNITYGVSRGLKMLIERRRVEGREIENIMGLILRSVL